MRSAAKQTLNSYLEFTGPWYLLVHIFGYFCIYQLVNKLKNSKDCVICISLMIRKSTADLESFFNDQYYFPV